VRELLRDLFKAPGGLELFHFHEKYQVTPAQILVAVEPLLRLGVIESEAHRIRLTTYGRKWVVANRARIFLQSIDQFWKTPPVALSADRIEPFEPYVPKHRSSLNPAFFKAILDRSRR
jgi:hypothetical protein